MAVIKRTECLVVDTNSIRSLKLRQGHFILVLLFVGVLSGAATPLDGGCLKVQNDFASNGFPTGVLEKPIIGRLCGAESCCSNQLENELSNLNRKQINSYLKDSVSKVSSLIDVRAKKFDGMFRELMNSSKTEFDAMFRRTYGKLYLQNVDLFIDFFTELETYYRKGTVRLTETLEKFFGLLYQRMFTVINSHHTFDENYLDCVLEHMMELKPFGDIPTKLTSQLRRSFVATRTYHRSLAGAAEAARRMQDVQVEERCERELLAMQSCGRCRGRLACAAYCTETMERCMGSFTALGADWDSLIDALDKIAERLIGPYNVESVVEPLNIKISEAIMIFQENRANVSKRIYSYCGTPSKDNRRRRATSYRDLDENPRYEIKQETMQLNVDAGHGNKKNRKNKHRKNDDNENMSEMERLLRDLRMKIKDARQFWQRLPYQYCNNQSISAPPSDADCWPGDGAAGRSGAEPKLSAVSSQQKYNLQKINDNLRKAYQGQQVEEVVDDSDDVAEGSGSGSGEAELAPEVERADVKPFEEAGGRADADLDIANEVEEAPAPTSTEAAEGGRGAAASARTITLQRALMQYLIPIVLVWFGGAITDLL